MELAFASWSGGKDCCLAFCHAIASGMKVRYLLNMVSEDGKWSWSHGLAAKWLRMQAQALGIPLLQRPATSAGYESEFKNTLLTLKAEGITAGVFGDIDFNEHREWINRVCHEGGDITPHLPLWGESQNQILHEFIDLGFKAVVVATRADLLGEEWLGRKLDSSFIADLAKMEGVTPCGEAGEYHTLVVEGPLFQKRLEIIEANKIFRDGYWFLNIAKCELV